MYSYEKIKVVFKDTTAYISLSRPQVRNAFETDMIGELTDAFRRLSRHKDIRAVLLKGEGSVFCAGADLSWMEKSRELSHEQNYEDAFHLSECLYTIYTCNKPTIAVVKGAAYGGANGLLAACDIAVAAENTVFSFSEVKLGLIPATIAPYVINRIGEYNARFYMLTGRKFDGTEAGRIGLVNTTLPEAEISEFVDSLLNDLHSSAPNAIAACKQLIMQVTNGSDFHNTMEYTSELLADIRESDEAREGITAFFEKRKPGWAE